MKHPADYGVEVCIPLLEEGLDVWRPVRARHISEGIYEIDPNEIPGETEVWKFNPGDRVICLERQLMNGSEVKTSVVAISKLPG